MSAAEENARWLKRRYQAFLFEAEPRSILDVGCGAGDLLREAARRDVSATGLDAAGPRLDACRADGLTVTEGSAYDLPFDDESFDWVAMRHVPHHLEDPARAFAEALRVARSGFLVAEPWFDTTLASQRAAIHLDVWEKTQHRRRGMYHSEVHELDALLAFANASDAWTVEVERHLWLHDRSIPEFEREARELLNELPEDAEQASELDRLLDRLRADALTWNGSLCLRWRRRAISR